MRLPMIWMWFLVLTLWTGAATAQPASVSIGLAPLRDLAQVGGTDSFAGMIENALVSTGRFRVVERERLGRLMASASQPSRRGRARAAPTVSSPPVDFLVEGTISSVGVRARTNIGTSLLGGLLSGLRGQEGNTHCSNQEATISMDVRVLHAGTREIRHVLRIVETQRAAAVCSGQPEVDMPRLYRAAADRVAAELVTSIYPILVAAVEADGTVVLNYGSGTVQPNSAYALYAQGQPIRDPATGQLIGNQETRLGYIRIREVAARISRATPVGSLSPQVGAVARLVGPQEVRNHERSGRNRDRVRR